MLPKEMVKQVPKNHLMTEQEWRSIGVQQSQGWVHYMTHQPGKHILLMSYRLGFVIYYISVNRGFA